MIVGLQVPPRDRAQLRRFLAEFGYRHWDESANPAYYLFLRRWRRVCFIERWALQRVGIADDEARKTGEAMIRLSRMGANIRCGAYLASAMLVAGGCAQNGIGNGGLGGGTGKGGAQAGAGGASSGAGGAIGGNGGSAACPLTEPVPGTPCTGSPHCPYGTTICCGVAMTDTFAECKWGVWILESNDTTCRLGLACPAGTSGQGGVAGALGAGGAGGVGGMNCPATPIPEGFSCLPGEPFLGCTYGSATCCGVAYPTLQLTCQPGDSVVHQAVENPCDAGYVCPTGGGGAGAGGAGGASGVTTCPAGGCP